MPPRVIRRTADRQPLHRRNQQRAIVPDVITAALVAIVRRKQSLSGFEHPLGCQLRGPVAVVSFLACAFCHCLFNT